MKRIIVLFVALCTVSMASAQSFTDLLKGAATEILDNVTGGKSTEVMLTGEWNYSSPAVRFVKDGDILSNVASSAVTNGLEDKLAKAYGYIGITEGSSSFKFNADNSFTAVLGRKNLSGTYTYDSATHKLTLEFTSLLKTRQLNGYAYISGESLELVFDCSKFMDFLVNIGSKVSALKGITSLASQYDSMMIGFGYCR